MDSTTAPATTRLTVDLWADVLCPWCYIGGHRLVRAVRTSSHAGAVDLRIRTFQLDPAAPATASRTLEHLSRTYGISPAQARATEAGLAQLAGVEGLRYEIDRLVGNTSDMLRLVHLGKAHGLAWEYLRAMQTEVFTGNEDAFEHATLVRLGERLGIPGEEIREALSTGRYTDAVRADHAEAVRLGATGVPFTVLGGRLGIPGTVSRSHYAAAIEQAWEGMGARAGG
jgi:predicted DsbA family dithiol-disulfide isomerase